MEEMGITIDALFKELVTTHEFDRFMRDQGWSVIGPEPTPEQIENAHFDLPFVPIITGPYDPSRHVHQ
jgi:hypothetical protein